MSSISPEDFEQALRECATEPIHQIGHVQPHGALLVISPAHDRSIVQASRNVEGILGHRLEQLLGQPLSTLLDSEGLRVFESMVTRARGKGPTTGRLMARCAGKRIGLVAHLFESDGLLVLELEPSDAAHPQGRLDELLMETMDALLSMDFSTDCQAYFQGVTQMVRNLTGYDSVMVYQFDSNMDGEVIAQSRSDQASDFLGMRFPASDIPPQARRLYAVNLVRVVADTEATPVPIVPTRAPSAKAPLDLSHSALRSLSPIHMEYLRNIGVRASLVISLMQKDRLWGMVTCHHRKPKHISIELREAAILVSRLVSSRLTELQSAEHDRLTERAVRLTGEMLRLMPDAQMQPLMGVILGPLQSLLRADGIVCVVEGRRFMLGETPGAPVIDDLLHWLGDRPGHEIFHTDCLSQAYPPAASMESCMAGLLSTPPTPGMRNCIVWLRGERQRAVRWAGHYEEGLVRNAAGNYRLTPRKSFELWSEIWRGRSEPWTAAEVEVSAMLALELPERMSQTSRLDAALGRLRQDEFELRQHRDHLEELVQQRTNDLSLAKELAESANRAKSTFLANMSHELRTPIHGIMGMTALAMRLTSDPKVKGYLQKTEQVTQGLLSLINDILDLSKIEADRLTLEVLDFRLRELVAGVENQIGEAARKKGVALAFDLAPADAARTLRGDPLRIGQILLNLVGNAVKFTDQGSVRVGMRIDTEADAAVLRVSVQDTGIGMSAEHLARLFSAFEQGDSSMTRRFGGTGLGLAITKRLVRMMGGDIHAESAPGAGSTFHVHLRVSDGLPSAEGTAPAVTSDAERRLKSEHAGTRVLVAEDEPVSREISQQLLCDAGCVVDAVADGAAAVQAARTTRYDVILMDMQMPVMNGIEATQQIRSDSVNRHTYIIAATANAFDDDQKACLAAGMNHHLAKPIDPDKLYEGILRGLQAR